MVWPLTSNHLSNTQGQPKTGPGGLCAYHCYRMRTPTTPCTSRLCQECSILERRAHFREVAMKYLYSTSWRFKAMRTPFTKMKRGLRKGGGGIAAWTKCL